MNMITKEEAVKKIMTGGSRIFSVTFTKNNGEKRIMTGRLNVKKGVSGKGMAYSPMSKGLLPMFDCQSRGFRMINLSTIESLRMSGSQYQVI